MKWLALIALLGAGHSGAGPGDVRIGLSMNIVKVKSITVTTTEVASGVYLVRVKGQTMGEPSAHTFQAERLVMGPVTVIYDGTVKVNP